MKRTEFSSSTCKKTMLFIAALCCLCAGLASCEPKPEECPPAPPILYISGTVADATGQPLQSIQINIVLPEREKELYELGVFGDMDLTDYSDENGEFSIDIWRYEHSRLTPESWSPEITVVATDTADIYETQTNVFSVKNEVRYPESSMYKDIIDGYVTADFLLRKVSDE